MSTLPHLTENEVKLLRKLHQKKYRDQWNLYFGEGYRLLKSAWECPKIKIRKIIVQEKMTGQKQGVTIRQKASEMDIPVSTCPESTMKRISGEVTPPGIFFTMEKPSRSLKDLGARNDRVIVFLEQISEPGNLGAILRSMVWFGYTTLVLSPGCVDPFNPKTIRASAGAIFESDIYEEIPVEIAVEFLKHQGYQVLATVPDSGITVHKNMMTNRLLVLFGSEANGLSDLALQSADARITIPKKGPVESLNLSVAAGIFFYQITMHMTA